MCSSLNTPQPLYGFSKLKVKTFYAELHLQCSYESSSVGVSLSVGWFDTFGGLVQSISWVCQCHQWLPEVSGGPSCLYVNPGKRSPSWLAASWSTPAQKRRVSEKNTHGDIQHEAFREVQMFTCGKQLK